VLIEFVADSGEYWDNSGLAGFKYAFEAAKAYAKGTRPHTDAQLNAKVSL
jgi:hypothetical protein